MKFKCDYKDCKNKPYAEIYAQGGWTNLCKRHFKQEKPRIMKKKGVWGYHLLARKGNWVTPTSWAKKHLKELKYSWNSNPTYGRIQRAELSKV